MASVIDSLIVKLGIDASGFKRGAQEAEEITKKTKKQVSEEAKAEAERKKKAEEGFRRLRASAMLFFAALTGARGLADFVKNTVAMGAGLDRSSKVLGVSANNLSKWGGAAKVAGGSMDAFMGTMQGLNQQLTQLKETGDAPMRMLLSRLGVAAADGQGRAKDVLTLTGDIADAMGKLTNVSESDKFNWLLGAGFDEGTARLMLMTEKQRKDLIASMKGMTDEQAKAMREIDERWTSIKEKYAAMSRDLLIKLMPSLERLSETLQKSMDIIAPVVVTLVDGFVKLNELSDGWLVTVLAAAAALKGVAMLLPGAGAAAAAGGAAAGAAGGGVLSRLLGGAMKWGAGGAALFHHGALNSNEESELARRRAMGATIDGGGDINSIIAEAERKAGLPSGMLAAIRKQETSNRQDFIDDPSKYHYGLNAEGKRIAGHTGKISTAFGPFGILESTAKNPGFGVTPLQNKSLQEQARFAAEYAAARAKYGGGWHAGLSGYGEGTNYANQVLSGLSGGGGSGGGNSSVTIGKVEIVTQATDANGMARDVHSALVHQFGYALR